jgi:hypothetical protein
VFTAAVVDSGHERGTVVLADPAVRARCDGPSLPLGERVETGRTLLLLGRALEDEREARRTFYRAVALFAELTSPYWLEQAESELQRLGGRAPPVAAPPEVPARQGLRAPGLVACSPSMRGVEQMAQRAATTELSVLITRRDRYRQGADRADDPSPRRRAATGRSSR